MQRSIVIIGDFNESQKYGSIQAFSGWVVKHKEMSTESLTMNLQILVDQKGTRVEDVVCWVVNVDREGKDGACIDICILLNLNNSFLDHLANNDFSKTNAI